MKASPNSKIKITIGVFILHLLLAGIVYFTILPSAFSASADTLRNIALLLLVFSLVATAVSMLAVNLVFPSERPLQEVIDSIRQPVLVVGGDNRYVLLNRDAEKVLHLSRERDTGKMVDQRILSAMPAGGNSPDTLVPDAVIEHDGAHYQVFNNPLPADSAGVRQHFVILRNVVNQVRLREAVRDINQTISVLNANTMKISDTAVSLSQGASEQASSLATITSSMDEFSRKIQGNTDSAAKSTQLAAQAREAAERSGGEIAHALSAMTDVQDAGIRIARIVKLIDDIAFQTNLLALNAAVEAARAGRQGKGFAVVADEVRNLAGRSAKAAKDTASMVEDVTERIGNASAYISKLEEMLRNIVQDAIRMADSSAAASTTSSEQASGILQVNRELGQMNSLTQTTMNSAEQTATAVEVLSKQINNLHARMDDVARRFGIGPGKNAADKTVWKNPELSINLLDEPASLPHYRSHSFLADGGADAPSSREDRYSIPEKPKKTSGIDWDLTAELTPDGTTPLANLLREDGYEQNYRTFLESATKSVNAFTSGQKNNNIHVPETKTPEGDRVVKPGQNIQLDDSEFGRY